MADESRPIRILIVDDHRLFREGLAGLLAAEEEFQVVGEAGDGGEALRLVGETQPDVVILDVTLPGENGISVAGKLREVAPKARILALSMHVESRFVAEMFRAGAGGYVVKMCEFDELSEAVRVVASGGNYVTPQVAGEVVREVFAGKPAPGEAGLCAVPVRGSGTPGGMERLSERELEILRLLADGKSAKESAVMLHVSVKTIDSHRRQIMQKLGLNSVAELTKFAIRSGLTSL